MVKNEDPKEITFRERLTESVHALKRHSGSTACHEVLNKPYYCSLTFTLAFKTQCYN
jgi:hypothetical protein